MSVFVDTSAFLALFDADDAGHERIRAQWTDLVHADSPLWCTSYVLVETCALLQSRLGLAALRLFDEDVLPVIAVHWVAQEEHREGMAAVLAAGRKNLSLVDCVSFAVMRARGTRTALTLDRHFVAQGFEIVPATG
ncbi:MAG: type II toxin-antitoxin system VapC family toxin [Deltaproteobacteria bacterium]|nr:type II toxin-antitoxin system VapC family toxin [Deltaproteobacteria bacterium]